MPLDPCVFLKCQQFGNASDQFYWQLPCLKLLKTDPTRFQIADISKTHMDPMAKIIRQKLKKSGIKKGIPVVFSDESPIVIREDVKETVGAAPMLEITLMPLARHSFIK